MIGVLVWQQLCMKWVALVAPAVSMGPKLLMMPIETPISLA
jgi:hypothetical protein